MRKIELRVQDYLEHARQAIERIQRYTRDMDEAAFLQNEMAQDAVIRNIEIIGERSKMHCTSRVNCTRHSEVLNRESLYRML